MEEDPHNPFSLLIGRQEMSAWITADSLSPHAPLMTDRVSCRPFVALCWARCPRKVLRSSCWRTLHVSHEARTFLRLLQRLAAIFSKILRCIRTYLAVFRDCHVCTRACVCVFYVCVSRSYSWAAITALASLLLHEKQQNIYLNVYT
jgi:hypothetical protein